MRRPCRVSRRRTAALRAASITCALRSLRRTAFSSRLRMDGSGSASTRPSRSSGVVEEIQAGAAPISKVRPRAWVRRSWRWRRMPARSPIHKNGSYAAANTRAHARESATGRSCNASVVMPATVGLRHRPRIARNGHWRRMARSGDRRTRRGAEGWLRRRSGLFRAVPGEPLRRPPPSEIRGRACDGCSPRGGAPCEDSRSAARRSRDR